MYIFVSLLLTPKGLNRITISSKKNRPIKLAEDLGRVSKLAFEKKKLSLN